jgi:23S rRNA pseudouridine955/2504/2580 synthase
MPTDCDFFNPKYMTRDNKHNLVVFSGDFAPLEFTINKNYHDVRLDRFVRKTYKDIALTSIFRLIRKGLVKVNGKKKKQNYRLQEGDTVYVNIRTAPSTTSPLVHLSSGEKDEILASIVYENDDILLCNKPPGLVMHRGSSHDYGLVEMMQSATRNPDFTFVNRIDKATSGLVLGAKNPIAIRKLSKLFRQRAIEKYYLVMVEGIISEDNFTISSYLKKTDERVEEHKNDHNGAKKAVSSFSVVKRLNHATLLEVRLFTGRTHQLRVQLAGKNHPIIGDAKYGKGETRNMLLFSRRVVIPTFALDVTLPIPNFFYLPFTKN